MARITTIANNKGGVGKTATAVNFAAALRNAGRDVLCIDLDAQGNLTACFGIRPDGAQGTTFDALKSPVTPYVQPVRVLHPDAAAGAGVLDVLPAVRDLSAVEAGLVTEADRFTRFRSVVDKYRDKYDCIVIDTPPAVGMLTISALYAADETIIAVQPEFLAVQGLMAFTETLATLNRGGASIQAARVLFTQYDRRKGLHRLTVEQVEAAGFAAFNTKIRENVALGEAPAAGVDIFRYNRRSNGAADYAALCAEYLNATPVKHVKHGYKAPKPVKTDK